MRPETSIQFADSLSGRHIDARMAFYVYIVANRRNGTIYTGMTDNLAQRIEQHRIKIFRGFTAKYGCDKLVWYEVCDTHDAAFHREREIKEWRRSWKLMLIEAENPTWSDLHETLNR